MSDIAIRCEGLSKRYRIGERESYKALRDVITDGVASPFRRLRSALRNGNGNSSSTLPSALSSSQDTRRPTSDTRYLDNTFWALDEVSFEVKRGEVVGIIGRNGAGKSTLLKILSRITKPTKGHAKIHGRVGSLLEVGTGFHPELTGRENIYLNAAILGMRKAEVERKFDEIVAFAEVEKFIDTPVKRYSSGMYVRLAFAVAAHMETEVLLVDEVLAVGDSEFQKKCLGKMDEVAGEGRIVMFVSHNMTAISTLTHRALLMQTGRVVKDGTTSMVIGEYLRGLEKAALVHEAQPWSDKPRVTRVEVVTSDANNVNVWSEPFEIRFQVTAPQPVRGLCLSFQIFNAMQQPVLHLWSFDSEREICREPGIFELVCRVPKLRLYMGSYSIKFYLSGPPGSEMFEVVENVCPFEVVMHGHYREFEWQEGTCSYIEDCDWEVRKVS